MKFCSICSNMLYTNLTRKDAEAPKLIYLCKHCGTVETFEDSEGGRIFSTDYADDQASFNQYMTPLIKHDPTLPRVSSIACPNEQCKRKEDESNDVIYIKYDNVNLKYLYHCVHCEHFWKALR